MPRQPKTKRQEKFIQNMTDPKIKSATEAAKKAGYSKKNSRVIASQNLTKLNILSPIEERKKMILAQATASAAEVIGGATFQMRSSIDDCLDEAGSFDIRKARETGLIHLVKKHKETITTNEGGTKRVIEVELLDNQSARKELAGYMGIEKPERITPDLGGAVAKCTTFAVLNDITEAELPDLCRQYVEFFHLTDAGDLQRLVKQNLADMKPAIDLLKAGRQTSCQECRKIERENETKTK